MWRRRSISWARCWPPPPSRLDGPVTAKLLDWLSSFGPVDRVGVEGTGAWGAGLCRYLTEAEVEVCEVVRPNRQHRRRYGKSDVTDAIAAARAVLSGEASGRASAGFFRRFASAMGIVLG